MDSKKETNHEESDLRLGVRGGGGTEPGGGRKAQTIPFPSEDTSRVKPGQPIQWAPPPTVTYQYWPAFFPMRESGVPAVPVGITDVPVPFRPAAAELPKVMPEAS